MMFGISSIGWSASQEETILHNVAGLFSAIEVVPSRFLQSKIETRQMAEKYRQHYGMEPYSAQALFYGSNVTSFEDADATYDRLMQVLDLADLMGVKRFVLGSPNLRKGSPSLLMRTLEKVDKEIRGSDIYICIEPVHKSFGGKYFCSVAEIVDFLQFFGPKNIKTMLDSNSAWLSGESPSKILSDYKDFVYHLHVSDTDIGPMSNLYEHRKLSEIIVNSDYSHAIMRELKPCGECINEYRLFSDLYYRVKDKRT